MGDRIARLKTILSAAAVLAGLLGIPARAEAAAIVYTETARINGSLNGVAFFGNTLTLTGFTSTLNVFPAGCCFIATLTLAFSVEGVGAGTFTDFTRVVSNQTVGSAGFGDVTLNRAILFTSNPAFSTYDLKTSIGPLVGTASFNSGFSFPTTSGSLIIQSSGDATFTAIEVVPLPAATWLLVSALGVLGWMRKKTA